MIGNDPLDHKAFFWGCALQVLAFLNCSKSFLLHSIFRTSQIFWKRLIENTYMPTLTAQGKKKASYESNQKYCWDNTGHKRRKCGFMDLVKPGSPGSGLSQSSQTGPSLKKASPPLGAPFCLAATAMRHRQSVRTKGCCTGYLNSRNFFACVYHWKLLLLLKSTLEWKQTFVPKNVCVYLSISLFACQLI